MSKSVTSLLAEAEKARDDRRWGAAAELYAGYLKQRPRDAGIWVQYGHTLKESGNLDAADGAYLEALRRRPWEADTYHQIGHLRKVQQRPAAALFWYRQALGLAARHADARREAESLEAQGIVEAPERLPAPWISVVMAILKRVRHQAITSPSGPERVVSKEADTVSRSGDPFETAWRQYLPAFMEAASNIAALGHEYARLRRDFDRRLSEQNTALRDEIAVLREQIEQTRVSSPPSPEGAPGTLVRLLTKDQLKCDRPDGWSSSRAGYIRVKADNPRELDMLVAADSLPFDRRTVDEIMLSHVLERCADDEIHRLLIYWLSLLKPGGRLVAVVPDSVTMIADAAKGALSIEEFRSMLFGSHELGAQICTNMFSYERLTTLLKRAGFDQIEIPSRGRANGSCVEFEIRAYAREGGHD